MATYPAGETVTGSLTSQAAGTPFRAIGKVPFNVFVTNTFSLTWSLQRSFDEGTTWVIVPLPDISTPATFTTTANFSVEEPQSGVLYRVNVSAFTSGQLDYRFVSG